MWFKQTGHTSVLSITVSTILKVRCKDYSQNAEETDGSPIQLSNKQWGYTSKATISIFIL